MAKRGFELRDRTIGLIGHSNIGQALEQMVRALGTNVVIHDPRSVANRPLDTVLTSADVVVLSASHVRGRSPIIGPSELATMHEPWRPIPRQRHVR